MSEEDGIYSIECGLGNLSLKVQGEDEDWVRETFREEWLDRMAEAGDMAKAVRDGTRGCM